ncbi:MAG: PQQ-like beta-propeller repeat protein [Tannerella sp.]|jgi:outer membrane protein assembly factor BamB|nr:PQQ-like beta-propeller repeat protein [Tannerella sp.]
MKKIGFIFLMMATVWIIAGMDLYAQDWPQWRGANRDGISKEIGLNLDWTAKKPALMWTFKQAGAGYSSPSIVGTTLYGQGNENGKDFVFALDTQTGNQKWKQILGDGNTEQTANDRGAGPRGSVTVDGDKLYLIRSGGQINCLSAADGKMIWQKSFLSDFGGKMMSDWGFSESPLVDGNLVVCTPGGSGGTLVALDKNTGATIWRTTAWTDEAGYSSAIVAEAGGIRQYIQQSGKGVAGISSKDGKLLWKIENPAYRTAVIPTAIFQDNMIYVTNGYRGGCMGIQLTKQGDGVKAETVYTNPVITNQHGGVVLANGHIYGYSENPSASWVCQNFKTGKVVWEQKGQEVGVGKGSVFCVGDRLLLMEERSGTITVISASPDGWKVFGKLEIPERSKIQTQDHMVWTHLVVANGKLYLKDHDLLFCFNLK